MATVTEVNEVVEMENESTGNESTDIGAQLKSETCAVRVSRTNFGVMRRLNNGQQAQAASSFGANGAFLRSRKKLIDTRHKKVLAVTSIMNRATSYFKDHSLPYPERGIRLIRRSDVEKFEQEMTRLSTKLEEAVSEVQKAYEYLRNKAKEDLGTLFSESDYPVSLEGSWSISWDFPSCDPPEYLKKISPKLYEREQQRVLEKFQSAVGMAEEAFTEELQSLVAKLRERLTGETNGKPAIFRDSAVTNLAEFFERFKKLNIGSNQELDALVAQAEGLMNGVVPKDLRKDGEARKDLAEQLEGLSGLIEPMLTAAPERAFSFDDE